MKKAHIILLLLIGTGACMELPRSQTIMEAVRKGDIAALRAILRENPVLVGARGERGQSPLQEALLAGQSEAVRFLIAAGADVNSRDEMGRTPLHRAVLARDVEIVRLLLAGGADPLVRSAYGNTPLDLALQEGLVEIAGLLPAAGKAPVPRFPSIAGPYLGQPPPGLSSRMFAPGIVSTERDELNAVFTPDGNEFYFTIHDASGRWTIMMMKAENGRWSRPRPASFSGRWSDVDLFITADGRRLYFCSDRPLTELSETRKDFDIWMSERAATGWSKPVNLGAPVNSSDDEFYPSLTGDGTIYFQSRRPGGPGLADIWRSRPAASGYAAAECLPPPVNSAGFEGDTLVALDESYLIVSASRDPPSEQADLFLSFPGPNGTWTPLVKLGFEVSSARSGENCQMLSPDGRYLFFTRDGDIYWIDAAVIEKSRPAVRITGAKPG